MLQLGEYPPPSHDLSAAVRDLIPLLLSVDGTLALHQFMDI